MKQLNIEIDDDLYKKVKYACVEDGTNLKKWVSAALELALDFDQVAMTRCGELGWIPGAPPGVGGVQEPVEVIDEPPPSKLKRVNKS